MFRVAGLKENSFREQLTKLFPSLATPPPLKTPVVGCLLCHVFLLLLLLRPEELLEVRLNIYLKSLIDVFNKSVCISSSNR